MNLPDRREFLSREAWLLACAEQRHRAAVRARRWFWFRVCLCVASLPVCLLWLYACAYL